MSRSEGRSEELRQGSHEVGFFHLSIPELHSLKYWSAVTGSLLQNYQDSRKPWP